MMCDELKRFDIVGKYSDEETMYEFRPDGECYDVDEVDAAIAELKAENRRLKRALWLARAERAAAWQVHWALCHNHSIEREFSIIGIAVQDDKHTTMKTPRDWSMIWKKVASKCRAKAEEYK